MEIAICDDNTKFRTDTEKLILESGVFITCHITHFNCAEKMLESIADKNYFDIILLDIEMNGMNGIQAGEKLKSICTNSVLIYISSYSKYAIDSFDNNPLHYILKPIDKEKFLNVLFKAKSMIEELYAKIDIIQKDNIFSIQVKDIVYIEYYKKHLTYYCKDQTIESVGKVKDIYAKLGKFGFILINQGTLVNASHIKQISKDNIITSQNDILPISVRKKTEVINRFVNFVKGKVI